ncbi:TetR/AcrR family transcriptional regulator [[Clostridium] symbiosum]|uniref:TetR/AcrR family transcriptional regulator n=1 Tax=Clostridium symbiosum TaxID=1512 RepID=UPI001FA7213D|nr:TetR/AcrR family transcriptional regulator [[Clostridium] symbiosum]
MYSIYEHVHLSKKGDDTVRKKDDSLRGALIDYARELAEKEGPEAVNIRSLAGKAGIATGTVYNYFSCKDEILLALTEEYWRKTLADMRAAVTAPSFCGQLEEIFTFFTGAYRQLRRNADAQPRECQRDRAGENGIHAGGSGSRNGVSDGAGSGHTQ